MCRSKPGLVSMLQDSLWTDYHPENCPVHVEENGRHKDIFFSTTGPSHLVDPGFAFTATRPSGS